MPPGTTEGARLAEHLAARAKSQAGVFSRAQALEWGVTLSELKAQLAAGRILRLSEGVYFSARAVPGLNGRRWAALLASGEGAVLSHWTAAAVYGLTPTTRPPRLVEVSIPATRREVAAPGVRVRRSRLLPDKATVFEGWPITTPADTVLDLASTLRSPHDVVAVLTDACRCTVVAPEEIASRLAGRRRQRHRRLILEVVADIVIGVESTLERHYLVRVERAHGLPKASRQVERRVQGRKIREDLEYEEYDTVVELDGRMGHEGSGRHRDRLRDNANTSRGKATLRYGHADLKAPCAVAAEVGAVLQRNGWKGRVSPCGPACQASVSSPGATV